MEIGHRIKYLRELKKLTQEELGKIIGVNKATVNRYETGIIDIKRTTAIKLAEVFDVSPAYIMGWDEETQNNKLITEYTINQKEIRHLTKYRNLNPTGQQKADEYISDLSEQPKYTIKSVSDTIADDIINELKQIATAPMGDTIKRK